MWICGQARPGCWMVKCYIINKKKKKKGSCGKLRPKRTRHIKKDWIPSKIFVFGKFPVLSQVHGMCEPRGCVAHHLSLFLRSCEYQKFISPSPSFYVPKVWIFIRFHFIQTSYLLTSSVSAVLNVLLWNQISIVTSLPFICEEVCQHLVTEEDSYYTAIPDSFIYFLTTFFCFLVHDVVNAPPEFSITDPILW